MAMEVLLNNFIDTKYTLIKGQGLSDSCRDQKIVGIISISCIKELDLKNE